MSLSWPRAFAITLVASLGVPLGAADGTISMASLLSELTDLARMAEFPAPAYTCRQASSYNRASKAPGQPGWFDNGDYGQYVRSETRGGRTEHVMMEAKGPGCIVRIWSADPKGTVRFYIDGAEEPTFEAPFKDILGGTVPGLPAPLSGVRARGCNLYLPMPYATSCKVTIDEGGSYYHVNYRTYPAGTAVASFSPDQIAANANALLAVAKQLAEPGRLNAPPAGATTTSFSVTLAPGASATLASLDGPQALRLLRLDWRPTADRDEPALRATTIAMSFDSEQTVLAPLGDLFGSGPGVNTFESLPLGVAKDGRMECRWVMPFRKSATISVTNHGPAPVPIAGSLVAAPYSWGEASMLFHASWRIGLDIKTRPNLDWNYLTATGRGVYAGSSFTIDNPNRSWWGEGDEKIYVDGEVFPGIFGTGAEDYYGYAWCSPALFTHAYHAQPRCDGPGNGGRTSVNRFHILDRIPFTRDFRFDMEIEHWNECVVNAAVTNYWYARPGATDATRPPTSGDLTLRPKPDLIGRPVPGAIEGESMRLIELTKGESLSREYGWEAASSKMILLWHDLRKREARIVLGFPVGKAGSYRVLGRISKLGVPGAATFAFNGQPACAPVDLPGLGGTKNISAEFELGTATLAEGENRLAITMCQPQEKVASTPHFMLGLDYIRLEPAP